MGVLLEAFFRIPPQNSLPSPADGDRTVPWWWDHLASQANDLRRSGFTAVWLPPVLKNDGGTKADGYAPFDDYDIGSRNQKNTVPTRYGTRQQLQRCVAMMRANGLDVYVDMVEHHRKGDIVPFVFRYPDASGVPSRGRFPKNPSNFVPQVPRDPHLGGAVADDAPFGRELAPINALPHHYVFTNLIDAADWLTRALDLQGYRLDDVKGLSTDFLLPFLNSKSMAGKFAVGEFFDGNRALVIGWIANPRGMQGRSSAFDFPLKFVLNAMCDNAGRFNMADLDHVGLAGIAPLNAVTFVENADTDIAPGQAVIFNKMLGYAYILTSEGYPCVYYRDYSTDKHCFGLKPGIDNLIWIHEKLAGGPTEQRWKDFDVFAYERLGGPHLLVGLNNDPGISRTVTVVTGFGSGVGLHDYTGHGGDVTTDGNGNATITIPPNNNGNGYACYSRAGIESALVINSLPVTQDFDAAQDLDIAPAVNDTTTPIGSIWCDKGSAINARLKPNTDGWTVASSIEVQLLDSQLNVLASQQFALGTPPETALRAVAPAVGFYALHARGTSLPASGGPFTLTVTYHAPARFADDVVAAQAAFATDPAKVGRWSKVIPLPNVPIHTHVLPNGNVLFWGRRAEPGSPVYATLNEHFCDTFVWDPVNAENALPVKAQNRPVMEDGTEVNLFCSGHTFLPDGRLLVVGGHLFDAQGLDQACIYACETNQWAPTGTMANGRWYPTPITLADGRVFVMSGSMPTTSPPAPPPDNHNTPNTMLEVWEHLTGAWTVNGQFNAPPLFPRLHLAPDGRAFMSGGLALSQSLNVDTGIWTPISTRSQGNRDYAPSVMYEPGKVLFIGGGSDSDPADMSSGPPSNIVEIIDLNVPDPQWRQTSAMTFARRQHNATILADGTVLVTGGTQGKGTDEYSVFNDLSPRAPVHFPELWVPQTAQWSVMAAEAVDRCYHSTAVLLPDARIMSGGGGEYDPTNQGKAPNDKKDTHSDCQIYEPPYLCRGSRPTITSGSSKLQYGQSFVVQCPQAADIAKITFIRLSSVTHSFNTDQRLNSLTFSAGGTNQLNVTAPANADVCPPGFYMLFVLNQAGIPSVAKIMQIAAPVATPQAAVRTVRLAVAAPKPVELPDRRPVVVGVTATCPYGISACWGGAYHALSGLNGVQVVRNEPDAAHSTADVFLKHDGLPDLDHWASQFARTANGTHLFRGAEVTVDGTITIDGGQLVIAGDGVRPAITLMPIQATDKVQWDPSAQVRQSLTADETSAYDRILEQILAAARPCKFEVTGPLLKAGADFVLEVRLFHPLA